MRLSKWLLVGLLLLIPLSVQAQSEDWHVVTYEWERGDNLDRGGVIDVVTTFGVVLRHQLPDSILPADRFTTPDIAISDDLQFAAVAYGVDDMTSAPPLLIYDLNLASCCVTVTPPLANPQTYSILGFSADSSQLAFSYVAFPDANKRVLDGELVVAVTKTGAIAATLDLKAIRAAAGWPKASYAMPLAWTADGIRFIPSCWMCEGTIESAVYVWDPTTGDVSKAADAHYSIFGDVLPQTGELLYTVDNTAFPGGTQPGYIPPANVVEYYAGGIPDDSDTGKQTSAPNATIVYHDLDNLNLPKALWVADGRAFLLRGSADNPAGTLVFRDQTQIDADFGESDRFIAATPDGWLGQDDMRNINHYIVGDGTVAVEQLDQLSSRVYAVWSPRVGEADLPPFVGIKAGEPSG